MSGYWSAGGGRWVWNEEDTNSEMGTYRQMGYDPAGSQPPSSVEADIAKNNALRQAAGMPIATYVGGVQTPTAESWRAASVGPVSNGGNVRALPIYGGFLGGQGPADDGGKFAGQSNQPIAPPPPPASTNFIGPSPEDKGYAPLPWRYQPQPSLGFIGPSPEDLIPGYTPMEGADPNSALEQVRRNLVQPNKIVGPQWMRLGRSTQDFLRSGYKSRGIDPNDVNDAILQGLPGAAAFRAPYSVIRR